MLTPILHAMVPTPDELAAAREWLTHREWTDADDVLIAELSPWPVFRAVDEHYQGGWAAFVRTTAETPSPLHNAGTRPR